VDRDYAARSADTSLRDRQRNDIAQQQGSDGNLKARRPPVHPADSTIFYGDAMIVDEWTVANEIAAGLAIAREKCPAATLKLVQQGVAASPFTRPKILRFCKEQWSR
jgi:hypothetical protein